MSDPLSHGAILAMYQDDKCVHPVLQVLEVKKILSQQQNQTGPERYRLILSDGTNYMQAMLATQLNRLVNESRLLKGSIIKLLEFTCNTVHDRRIIIVLQIDVVGGAQANIGNPANIEQKSGGQPPQPQAQPDRRPPPQQQQQNNRPQQPPVQNSAYSNQNRGKPAYANNSNNQVDDAAIQPIRSLNPYRNKWTIKARVTSKGQLKHWNSQKGSGVLFSIDLLDAQGGEIRATMFGDAANHFEQVFQDGEVYLISKGQLKIANKKFNNTNNDYELTFDMNTQVVHVQNDEQIRSVQLEITRINDIDKIEPNGMVDVLGVIHNVGDHGTITTRKGDQLSKRTLTLLDTSSRTIDLTIWGKDADREDWQSSTLLGVKNAKVSDFGGRSLTALGSSKLIVNPVIPEAQLIHDWYTQQNGYIENIKPMTTTKSNLASGEEGGVGGTPMTINELKTQVEGLSGTGQVSASCHVTVLTVKHDDPAKLFYPACPQPDCKGKKLDENFSCPTCRQTQDPEWRYMLRFAVMDYSGQAWVGAFNIQAKQLLGNVEATTLRQIEQEDKQRYEQIFESVSCRTFQMKINGKMDDYGTTPQFRGNAAWIKPVTDYGAASRHLIAEIAKLM